MSESLDLANPLAAFRLDGEVAIVTGGGSGIGRAVATAFARLSARVIIVDRDAVTGAELAAEITAAHGKAEAHALDVTDEAGIEQLFADAFERHGRIDVLVNSAGIAVREAALELPRVDWEKVMAVNATGAFLCARAAARHMLTDAGGRIVNIASIMGFSGGIYPNASYQASKGAVVNLTRALAVEWAQRNVRVNAVAPTYIRTPLTAGLLQRPEAVAEIMRHTPMGRIGEPEDVVGAVIFLASRASSLVTGHTLVVDGGFLAV
jgi:NAD(P)-dependent dehydrogenase (short-subunit alcohol dehydrogenase family)